ncbi:hypothetical protein J3A83DRAFT_3254403 [Scleroderma citrinum]
MDGWVDYLHFTFLGEHVLFSSLRLGSLWSFLLSSILVGVICLLERFLTALSGEKVQPRWVSRSRLLCAGWNASLYGLVTLCRLLYMLVAMSYQVGMIAIVVISLSIGQFIIEYRSHPQVDFEIPDVQEPLLESPRHRKTRTKSRPDSIFIHPYYSNLARADAAALELGTAGDTEFVQGNKPVDDHIWDHGKGRDVARELFGSNK